MKKSDLKIKLKSIIDNKTAIYNQLKNDKGNPQVKELISQIDAEIGAFRAVLDALNDNNGLINCYTSGLICDIPAY
jgi:hypothetical protein